MSENFNDGDISELMGDESGLPNYEISFNDDQDVYEGYSQYLSSSHPDKELDGEDSEFLTSIQDCKCYDEAHSRCLECKHSLGCQDITCDAEEHERSLKFAFARDCPCFEDSSSDPCESCGHKRSCKVGKFIGCLGHAQVEFLGQASEEAQSQKRGARWHRADDEALIEEYRNGTTFIEIARLSQRTVGGIKARLIKLAFELKGVDLGGGGLIAASAGENWNHDEDELVEKLFERRVEVTTIAEVLNRSKMSIAYRLLELRRAIPGDLDLVNYPGRPQGGLVLAEQLKWTQVDFFNLRQAYNQGLSIHELAKQFGQTELSCFAILYARGELDNEDLDAALISALSKAAEN